jgi:hypothetical protein
MYYVYRYSSIAHRLYHQQIVPDPDCKYIYIYYIEMYTEAAHENAIKTPTTSFFVTVGIWSINTQIGT